MPTGPTYSIYARPSRELALVMSLLLHRLAANRTGRFVSSTAFVTFSRLSYAYRFTRNQKAVESWNLVETWPEHE